MKWEQHGRSWPNSEISRFEIVDRTRYHVQRTGGEGLPKLLMLHGSGATTHSLAALIENLRGKFDILAPDIPGHGFSGPLDAQKPTLPNIAKALGKLLEYEDFAPDLVVGHSAGAAIAVQMQSTGVINVGGIVSINGAFYPFPGMAGHLFPAIARLLFLNPFVPHLFAFGAGSRGRVQDLIDSTGSKLGPEGIDLYQKAISDAEHVEGTLAMMANWDLEPMATMLRHLNIPVLQIIGGRDGTIEPKAAQQTARLLRHDSMVVFPDKGHLVHEEAPDEVADAILHFVEATVRQEISA
ncbi:alpha/beta fold hydrolase BchO [Pseudahrensia aquimaris]|uniref:Alpha/beta fold hydrolase BchO n=1 Tax=Pseudahrensia aquimaris TaxID=744461 RepID=A0ABW3FLD7_9HYPH